MSHTLLKRAFVLILLLAASGIETAASAQRGRIGIGIGRRGMGGGRGRANDGRGEAIRNLVDRIQRQKYLFTETGDSLEYATYVSWEVDPRKPSPLVIALHGKGVGPENIVRAIGFEAEERGYIVAAPMGYNLEGWYGANGPGGDLATPSNLGELSEKDVMQVLDIMLKTYNIDRRRIYLVGSSMGGAGALHLGIKYDTIWAAVAAAAPAFRSGQNPAQLDAVKHLPIMFAHGTRDSAVPIGGTRLWVSRMKELGMKYEYYEIEDGGHSGALGASAERVFKFFGRHRKPASTRTPSPSPSFMFQTTDVGAIDVPETIRTGFAAEPGAGNPITGVNADLNGDGTDDYIVQLPQTCGSGGCSFAIYNGARAARIGEVFGNTVIVRDQASHGFPNIDVYTHLSAQSGVVTSLVFDGKAYAVKTRQPAEGQLVADLFQQWSRLPRWVKGSGIKDQGSRIRNREPHYSVAAARSSRPAAR